MEKIVTVTLRPHLKFPRGNSCAALNSVQSSSQSIQKMESYPCAPVSSWLTMNSGVIVFLK